MLLGTVEELSFFQVTNGLARLTQDALAARLGAVREVMARYLVDIERSGAIQVNRGRLQEIDHKRLRERT
jgi:hypothetical protein